MMMYKEDGRERTLKTMSSEDLTFRHVSSEDLTFRHGRVILVFGKVGKVVIQGL
jgi:hypothetical protein